MSDPLMDALSARIAEQEAATAHLVEDYSRDLTGRLAREDTSCPAPSGQTDATVASPAASTNGTAVPGGAAGVTFPPVAPHLPSPVGHGH
jgi:hypothetical protein